MKGKLQPRIDWLLGYAASNHGHIDLSDNVMGDAFLKCFPETETGVDYKFYGYNPNRFLAQAAREAYKRGHFKRRVIHGFGEGARTQGYANYGVGYMIED